MTITFYYLSGSPFSWKVWLALEHKEIAYDLRLLSADAGDLKKPGFLAINPHGKVPAIADGAFTLYESSAIVEYLEDAYPDRGRPLWPRDVQARAAARRIAAEAEAYIYPPVRSLIVELVMRREGEPDQTAVADAKAALTRKLAFVERSFLWPFAAGAAPSAADFALYPLTALLSRISAKYPGFASGPVIPETIGRWKGRVEALPYFAKTIPPHWTNATT
ncbi:MAG: glutathione S-transferase family protein [Rhodomicrobium sp.]